MNRFLATMCAVAALLVSALPGAQAAGPHSVRDTAQRPRVEFLPETNYLAQNIATDGTSLWVTGAYRPNDDQPSGRALGRVNLATRTFVDGESDTTVPRSQRLLASDRGVVWSTKPFRSERFRVAPCQADALRLCQVVAVTDRYVVVQNGVEFVVFTKGGRRVVRIAQCACPRMSDALGSTSTHLFVVNHWLEGPTLSKIEIATGAVTVSVPLGLALGPKEPLVGVVHGGTIAFSGNTTLMTRSSGDLSVRRIVQLGAQSERHLDIARGRDSYWLSSATEPRLVQVSDTGDRAVIRGVSGQLIVVKGDLWIAGGQRLAYIPGA